MSTPSGFTYAASVIGYGRFGALWSEILSSYFFARGRRIALADTQAISSPLPQGASTCALADAVQLSEAVFLCVPISHMQALLKKIAPLLHPKALVCDTCSVKALPSLWMREILCERQNILATHPLFGPDSFTHDARHHNTIICSPIRMSAEDYALWMQRFSEMNLAPNTMDPLEHDKQAAYTQGLTHLLGRVLSALDLSPQVVSTRGYEALLEIISQTCSDSSTLFEDLQNYNSYSKKMRHVLQQAFADVIHTLDKNPTPPSLRS